MNPLLRMDSGFALVTAALTGKPQKDFMYYVNDNNIYDEDKLGHHLNDDNREAVIEIDSVMKSTKILKKGEKIGLSKKSISKVNGLQRKNEEVRERIKEIAKEVKDSVDGREINSILKTKKVIKNGEKFGKIRR